MQAEVPTYVSKQLPGLGLLASPCLCLCICIIVFGAGPAQLSGQAQGDWPEFLNTNMERWNPYETVLNVNNVGSLSLMWSFTTGSFVESAPAVANGVVYVGSDDDNVYALNAITGAKLWSFTTANRVVSAPAVANGVVYVGSYDDNVYALNASTGAKLWSFTTGDYVLSSPTVANGVVYVGSYDDNVYALNASTGAKLWSFTTGNGVFSAPAVANGVVYVGSGDENVYALNASTGARLWSFAAGGPVESPAVANGVVYVGSWDDNVYALNASTGAKLWSFTTGNVVLSSPAVANDVVYVGSYDGNVYALNASTGAKLWSFTTGNGVSSSPAVANGVVYVGSDDGNVYALNSSTGAKLWSFTGDPASSPAVANGVVYVGSDDGNVYAFSIALSLRFPVKRDSQCGTGSCTPTNAPINTVFDHYMYNAYECKAGSGGYGSITAFTAESASVQYGGKGYGACGKLYGYTNPNIPNFLKGYNYTGNKGDRSVLYYDSHPGIDYNFAFGKSLYPSLNGCVTYLQGAAGVPDPETGHILAIIPQPTQPEGGCKGAVNGLGYTVVYMHLSSYYDKSTQQVMRCTKMSECSSGQGIVPCPTCAQQNEWVSTDRGNPIGYSGNFFVTTKHPDGWGGVGPHLHFEVDQVLGKQPRAVDPYGWCGPGTDPYATFTGLINNTLWNGFVLSCPGDK
jgi:outer membrane protein assembly factor BamB